MSEITLYLNIATIKDISDWSYGRRFFELLLATDPRLEPQHIGEPDRQVPYHNVDSFRSKWAAPAVIRVGDDRTDTIWPLLWRRGRSFKYSGWVDFTHRSKANQLLNGSVTITSDFDKDTNWLKLFKGICELVEPFGGILHLLTKPELHHKTPRYSPYYPPINAGAFERKDLANIGWATLFGPLFADEVDFQMLSDRGYLVETFAGGHLVRMSESICDVAKDFAAFSRRRAELKSYFRKNLFRITDEPIYSRYSFDSRPNSVGCSSVGFDYF